MFWDVAEIEENSLQKLLKTNEFTLDNILQDEYTLQELRSGNKQLITFLTKPDILLQVVMLALCPDEDIDVHNDITLQYKRSHIASEILTVRGVDDMCHAFLNSGPCMDLLSKFFEKNVYMNHLAASFYMKIVSHMFARSLDQTKCLLAKANFLPDLLKNLRFGALAELLQNIVRIPVTTEDIESMKLWLVEVKLGEHLVDHLTLSFEDAIHENVAEVYIDIVKNLRDILYSSEDRDDCLHESLTEAALVKRIVDAMLTKNEDGSVNESLCRNASEMLVALIESNCVMHCPSHILHNERSDAWIGGNPDGLDREVDNDIWRPDQGRVVELAVAARTADIVTAIVSELESEDLEGLGENWWNLMKVLVAVCDTNYPATHAAIAEGFREGKLKKLFNLVKKFPLMSVFHHIVVKLVSFILYSNLGKEVDSPLLFYLFNECEIVPVTARGCVPVCVYPRMTLMSLRSFHISLAEVLRQASISAPLFERIEYLLRHAHQWVSASAELDEWLTWNRPDESAVPSARSSNANDLMEEAVEFFSSANNKAHQRLADYEERPSTKALSDHLDRSLDQDLNEALDQYPRPQDYKAPTVATMELKFDPTEQDINEDDFDRACSLRRRLEYDDWDALTNCKTRDVVLSYSASGSCSFPTNWDSPSSTSGADKIEPNRSNTCEEWPGSTSATTVVLPRKNLSDQFDPFGTATNNQSPDRNKDEGNDAWADFSSTKQNMSGNSDSIWNGINMETERLSGASDDWPLTSTESPAMDAVSSGLAFAITHNVPQKNESEA